MSTRVLAITQAIDDSATRYRVGSYVPISAAAGVEIELIPWPRDEKARRALVGCAGQYDSVVVQRRLLPVKHARALRRQARWLAYDFDDAVIYRDSARGKPWILLDKVWQFRALVSRCDATTAGNVTLAALASRYAKAERVIVTPTIVDLAKYAGSLRSDEMPSKPTPILGWIGHRGTLPYLERLSGALAEVSKRVPDVRLRCISDVPASISGVKIEHRRWSEATEARDLRELGVGLAPLPDDVWTRGKCGLRLLQYLAAGVPAVASPVGVQGEIVAAGAALGATSSKEWVEEIARLIADDQLREKLRDAGRALVRDKFSPAATGAVVLKAWTGRS